MSRDKITYKKLRNGPVIKVSAQIRHWRKRMKALKVASGEKSSSGDGVQLGSPRFGMRKNRMMGEDCDD
jgi:hypothetical protein